MKNTEKYNEVAAKIAKYCEKHSTINVAILFGSFERDGDKYSDLIYKLIGEYFDYLDYHDPKQLYA